MAMYSQMTNQLLKMKGNTLAFNEVNIYVTETEQLKVEDVKNIM